MIMRKAFVFMLLVGVAAASRAQTVPAPAPYPIGMRIIVGAGGSVPRNAPSIPNGGCGADNHNPCLATDSLPEGTYAVVNNNPPVLDVGGAFYWINVTYNPGAANQIAGWSRSIPPFLNMLTPPQMASGVAFSIVANYGPAPVLTNAVCINDGVNSAATMQLQSTTCCSDNGPGHVGTLLCPWPTAGVGNHKVVIQAVNKQGTAASNEFQFAVTTAPVIGPPTAPSTIRIR
jgi:hypothetical protein